MDPEDNEEEGKTAAIVPVRKPRAGAGFAACGC